MHLEILFQCTGGAMVDIQSDGIRGGGVRKSVSVESRVCLVISSGFPEEVLASLAEVPSYFVSFSDICGGPTGVVMRLGSVCVAIPARILGSCCPCPQWAGLLVSFGALSGFGAMSSFEVL